MNVTTHERPGVYSVYGASSLVRGSGGRKTVGLAAVNTKAEAGVIQTITSYEKAVAAFGSDGDEDMAELIRLALKNGAGGVKAVAVAVVPVANAEGYEAAFAAMSGMEDLSVVVCDSTDQEVQQKLRDSVTAASAARRERIAVVAGGAEESVTALTDRAKALNSERVVLAAPGGVSEKGTALSGLTAAAAVAGAIAGQGDPAVPLGGAELLGLNGLSTQYGDNDIDLLVRGGVTPLDSRAGTVSVVRGITTRTRSGESEDATWRELSTVLIVDDVIPAIRESLRARFRRAKNTEQSRGAIRSQVVLELENKKAREIITGYDGVTVTALPENPTVCLVEFAFTVAHGLNQIWLTASITI
mgnify:CR=1 FL=1